jgi:hypothetical protein
MRPDFMRPALAHDQPASISAALTSLYFFAIATASHQRTAGAFALPPGMHDIADSEIMG